MGAFANKFADYMPHLISVERFSGANNAYGEPLYDAPVTMQCRVEEKVRKVRDATGEEKVSTTMLYVLGGPLDAKDRITLPATVKGPRTPPILFVANQWDKSEYSHCEVYL